MKIPSLRVLVSLIIFFVLLQIPLKCSSQSWSPPNNNPIELGLVQWERDYEKALERSKKQNKPVFILFQEVPGCATCTNYGQEVMSHPLLVETIETFFVPLCIYNNKSGLDASVLKMYGEPSWNNPVIRIVDEKGANLIRRISGNYSLGGVMNAIIEALHKTKKVIPEYVNVLHTESTSSNSEELILGMYCFWTGEKTMATMAGIQKTEAGFMAGKEVVKVAFNPDIIDKETLIQKASKKQCADVVFDNEKVTDLIDVRRKGSFRKDPETKYYLYNSPYRNIPMTPLQSLKANYDLSTGNSPDHLLSPRQLALKGKSIKNLIGIEIIDAWLKEY
jgi:peptide methionine sulfoxide reductase MsrA